MDAPAILETLAARGAVVTVKPQADGEAVLNVAPKSALDAEILAEIRAAKPALISLLNSSLPPRPDNEPPEPPPHVLVVWDSSARYWRRSDGAGRFPTLATLAAYATAPESKTEGANS